MTALSSPSTRASTGPEGEAAVDRRLLLGVFGFSSAAGLVLYFYTASDLWLDEALSVNIARLPLADIPEALRRDGAPPLYYVLLHFWTALFGTGDMAVRSLSAACMVGTAAALWFAGRRLGGEVLAWVTASITLTNPYAARFATEARMYALVMLLVACGILTFQRVIEKPGPGRAATFGLVIALGCYTQYWWFYCVVVVLVLLAYMVIRGLHRKAAMQLLVATGAGVLCFVPWLPTFGAQMAHTGTPWGEAVFPLMPLGYSLRDFTVGVNGLLSQRQDGWVLLFLVVLLLLLGAAGRTEDERRIRLDLRLQPETRGLALVGGGGLALALSLNYLGGSAWQSRYSCIAFPFFILLVARGITLFRSQVVFFSIFVLVVALGVAGGVRNLTTERTQAGEVAAVLRAAAKPGDLVVYCPDQLGPSVHRLVPPGLREVTYPAFGDPAFVDWADYQKRLDAADPVQFATEAVARADGRTIWLVENFWYPTHAGTCEAIETQLRSMRSEKVQTKSDDEIWETPALVQFLPAQERD